MRLPCPALVAAVILAWAAVLGIGCNYVDDPLFCCTTTEACSRNQGPGVITPCTDPARPWCDNDGEYGPGRTCIADPLASPCDGPEDCSSERPYCVERTCVECEDNLQCEATTPVCSSAHLCGSCEGDGDCEGRADASRCFVADGACVACLEPADCSAVGAPICDEATHACRGCEADGECASDICDREAGACIAEASVIFLSPTGVGTGLCTRAAPCNSFAVAMALVSGSRNVIKAAPGTYSGKVTIDAVAVTILAEGATIQPAAIDQTVVTVTNAASATITGLTVDGATGPATGVGVRCDAASTLRLRRSVVKGSSGGGISISGCQFSLVNNTIARNGNASSTFGGVQLSSISAASGPAHDFEFNTVTGNAGDLNVVTGVACGLVSTALVFSNNIVYSNTVSGTGTQVGGDDDCSWRYSNVGPQAVAGDGNINADPQFVDAANRNYHLQPASPSRDVADPAATLDLDIDGDARPQGDRRDQGADEVVQ